VLTNFGADRAGGLHRSGTLTDVYAYLGPANTASELNASELTQFTKKYEGRMWGWYVCSPNQAKDVADIERLNARYKLHGWLLNIEKPLEKANLSVLLSGVAKLGKPIRASVAGYTPAHIEFDYRAMEKYKVAIDWQAYFDSGEGANPAVAVRELFETSFAVGGWEYRHRIGQKQYGWCKMVGVKGDEIEIDSYMLPTNKNGFVKARLREGGWGYEITDRTIRRGKLVVGRLYGRAAYSRSRVTIDTTRGAAAKRSLDEWTKVAASAKVPGSARRPVSVYLAESTSDELFRALAAGAPM
jgi:hypothetical protein